MVKNKYHMVASYQDGIARVELGLRREKNRICRFGWKGF